MKRMITLFVTLALAVVCFNFGPKPAAAADQIVIKQWYHQYGEAGTQDAVQKYADEYNKLHPEVKVEITWVPGDYPTKVNAALLTADAPDIFEVSGTVPADLVRAGQLATLDDLYTPEVIKDFGSEMNFETVEGHLYGIKMITDTGVLCYRKSLLTAAGVKPPTTFDDLIAAAKALTTKAQSGLFIGNDAGKGELFAKLMIWSAGGQLIKDGKSVFNTDRSAAAWAKLATLSNSGSLLVGAPADWWDPSALTDGLTAMQWCGLWSLPAITKALGDDFGVVAWPALDDKGAPATWNGGYSELVNAKSAHLAEAKAFVKWLWIENTADQNDWSLSYGFHIPPRASVAATADKLKSGPAADAVNIVTKYGQLEYPLYWTGAMDTMLTDGIVNVITKNADPKAELDAAAKKVDAELAIVMKK
jgi:multiple sugar transport system substrate-binding protein